jgi:hypothetical protein
MTQAKFVRFHDIAHANLILGGGIVGGRFVKPLPLVGTTLSFTTPSGTVTFTQDTGAPAGFVRFESFKTQVEAIANLKALLVNDSVAFKHATLGTAVVLSSATESARPVLGFQNGTVSGTAYNGPSGVVPKVVDFTVESNRVFVLLEV